MTRNRLDRAIALGIALAAFTLYAITACPTIYTEDSAEFSTAAALFGVPHPPGYPLFTMLSGTFVRAVPFGDIAYRSNLFSAACGAATLALLWMLLRRLQRERVIAVAAVACLAFGETFWSQCLVAEVHAFNCLLMVAALLAAIVAGQTRSAPAFAVCGALVGLWVGHRNLNALFVPALVALVVKGSRTEKPRSAASSPDPGSRLRLLLWALGGAAATAVVYVYLPLAARRDPPLNVGAPTTWARFYAVLSAQSYFRHFGTGDLASEVGRVWTFIRRLPADVGLVAFAAPLAFIRARATRSRAGAGTGVGTTHLWSLLFGSLLFVVVACVGFSALYNVIDIAAYFLAAHVALVVAGSFAWPTPRDKAPRRKLLMAGILAVALLGLPLNLPANNLRHTRAAHDYATDLLRSAPTGALLISFGDTADHVLGHAQAVEHQRRDVVVIHANQLTDWYTEQLRRQSGAINWPSDETPRDEGWLRALARANIHERPLCLTHPFPLGIEGAVAHGRGLLTCWHAVSGDADRDAASSARARGENLILWRAMTAPSARELAHAEVHVRMVAFAYAAARFELARTLVKAGDEAQARAQLQALLVADPDQQEREIAAALKTIGRQQRRAFAYGERAARALALPSGHIDALRAAIADN